MNDLDSLVAKAALVGRIPSASEARRWLSAVASVLADWGEGAGRGVRDALPPQLFRGKGARGRPVGTAGADAALARVALFAEVGRRAGEADPGKVGVALGPLVALVRGALPPKVVQDLLSALPQGVAEVLREASLEAPWEFRLLPQSYARPARTGPPH